MRGGVLCSLALVVMFWYCRALISDTRTQHYEAFCVYTKSAALGRTQGSFLRREPSSASLQFYQAVWTAEQRVEECWRSTEAALINNHLTLCRKERAWDSGATSSSRPNISLLLEPEGPCQFHRRNLGSKIRRKRAWILPGTLWCGRGSSAGDYGQLGMFEQADRCCREHDHCSHIIRPFTVNFGVFNPTFFTISHCDCDHRFKQCLLNVNDSLSNMVGYTFFHILKLRCFDLVKKRRCTQLNWFGMCTSVQDAPFAILKNPIPYKVSSSHPESSDISESPGNAVLPLVNGKIKNSKPHRRRKQSKGQRSNDPVAKGDPLKSEKTQKRYDKSKLLSPRSPPVRKIPTHPSLLTIQNSTFFHERNLTIISKGTFNETKHMHLMTQLPEPAKNTHKRRTISPARGYSTQKPRGTLLKNVCENKKKARMFRSQNSTVQIKMFQLNKPFIPKQDCDSMVSSMDHGFQLTQQKGINCKEKNASKHKSLGSTESPVVLTFPLFPRTTLVNKKQPKKTKFSIGDASTKNTSKTGPTVTSTSLPSSNTAMSPKPIIKASNSKHEWPNVTHAPRRRNPTWTKQSTPAARPRSTCWKDIVLSPKATSLVSVSFSQKNVRFKNNLSGKQETISSDVESIDGKKRCKHRRHFSLKSPKVTKRVTTVPRPKIQRRNLHLF